MQYSQHGNARFSLLNSKQNKRIELMRLCIAVALFITFFSTNSVVWASSEAQVNFAQNTRIMLFSPSEWVLSTFEQAKPGNEFYFNNQLYRVVDSDKAQFVLKIDASKLFEADRQYDKISRRPVASDLVQALDKDIRFVEHALLGTVQPGSTVRFQGRAHKVKTDRSLTNTGITFSSAISPLQRIEITRSGLQHIMDRHTIGGTMNAGKSIFNTGENIQALIKDAQLAAPVQQAGGNCQRVFDAGRIIGTDRATGKQTSTYRVITTQSGKLVTAYPVLQ